MPLEFLGRWGWPRPGRKASSGLSFSVCVLHVETGLPALMHPLLFLARSSETRPWGSLVTVSSGHCRVTPSAVHRPALMEARNRPRVAGRMKWGGGGLGAHGGGGTGSRGVAGRELQETVLQGLGWGVHKPRRGGSRDPGWKANTQRVGVCSLGVKLEPWELEEPGGLGSL